MRGLPRLGSVVVAGAAAAGLVSGQPAGWLRPVPDSRSLRVTSFDVGQADATLSSFQSFDAPRGACGVPFGAPGSTSEASAFTRAVGPRVAEARHAGAVARRSRSHRWSTAIVDDFAPSEVWERIPVPHHRGLQTLLTHAREANARWEAKFVVLSLRLAAPDPGVAPVPPDWERQRGTTTRWSWRVRYGDVAIVLLGDIGAATERAILPRLTLARLRILKVAHHGSRTSTSQELIDGWRPQIAASSVAAAATRSAPGTRRSSDTSSRLALRSTGPTWTAKSRRTDGEEVRVKTYVEERGMREMEHLNHEDHEGHEETNSILFPRHRMQLPSPLTAGGRQGDVRNDWLRDPRTSDLVRDFSSRSIEKRCCRARRQRTVMSLNVRCR